MTTSLRLYGIPNCDTVKKARAWLGERGVAVEFIDYKKHGVSSAALAQWVTALGWEAVLNRKGNTWRGLDDAQRAGAVDAAGATQLMLTQPSVIKRPVVEWPDGRVTVGFDAADWATRVR